MAVELHTFDEDGDVLLLLSGRPPQEAQNRARDTTVVTKPVIEKEPCIDIHLLVSSKHLMLASPVFKAMLKNGNFKEGQALQSTGRVEIPLPDDDAPTLILLLNIIHGRTRRVPSKVHLSELAKVASMVDKYQMHEAVEMFSDLWFNHLKEDIPTVFSKETLSNVRAWLGIIWVFQKSVEFKNITKMLVYQGDGEMEDCIDKNIPIPQSAVGKMSPYRFSDSLSQANCSIRKN
jgi:hypothetical protein